MEIPPYLAFSFCFCFCGCRYSNKIEIIFSHAHAKYTEKINTIPPGQAQNRVWLPTESVSKISRKKKRKRARLIKIKINVKFIAFSIATKIKKKPNGRTSGQGVRSRSSDAHLSLLLNSGREKPFEKQLTRWKTHVKPTASHKYWILLGQYFSFECLKLSSIRWPTDLALKTHLWPGQL